MTSVVKIKAFGVPKMNITHIDYEKLTMQLTWNFEFGTTGSNL